jgi:succinate dehydrogenase flavin-adding protein (antitoxin of CptAB toxin-antitoxin module)
MCPIVQIYDDYDNIIEEQDDESQNILNMNDDDMPELVYDDEQMPQDDLNVVGNQIFNFEQNNAYYREQFDEQEYHRLMEQGDQLPQFFHGNPPYYHDLIDDQNDEIPTLDLPQYFRDSNGNNIPTMAQMFDQMDSQMLERYINGRDNQEP